MTHYFLFINLVILFILSFNDISLYNGNMEYYISIFIIIFIFIFNESKQKCEIYNKDEYRIMKKIYNKLVGSKSTYMNIMKNICESVLNNNYPQVSIMKPYETWNIVWKQNLIKCNNFTAMDIEDYETGYEIKMLFNNINSTALFPIKLWFNNNF